jgi:hydroxypyruvate reductase
VELGDHRRVIVLGAGKAGAAMARALESILGDHVSEGFVVVKDGHRVPCDRIELAEAGHPVPDARGLAASARLLALGRIRDRRRPRHHARSPAAAPRSHRRRPRR